MFWLHGNHSSMHHCARTRVLVHAGNVIARTCVCMHACLSVSACIFLCGCAPAFQHKPFAGTMCFLIACGSLFLRICYFKSFVGELVPKAFRLHNLFVLMLA